MATVRASYRALRRHTVFLQSQRRMVVVHQAFRRTKRATISVQSQCRRLLAGRLRCALSAATVVSEAVKLFTAHSEANTSLKARADDFQLFVLPNAPSKRPDQEHVAPILLSLASLPSPFSPLSYSAFETSSFITLPAECRTAVRSATQITPNETSDLSVAALNTLLKNVRSLAQPVTVVSKVITHVYLKMRLFLLKAIRS